MSGPVRRRNDAFGGFSVSLLEAGPAGAETLVLLHGMPTGAELWRDVLGELAAAGYRGLAPDLPGYGLTRVPADADHSLAGAAELVAAWLRWRGDGPAWVVGHDIGGGVAQILAVRHPDVVSRLTLTNAVAAGTWPVPSIRLLRAAARRGLYPAMAASGLVPNPFVRGMLRHGFARPSRFDDVDADRVFWSSKTRHRAGREAFARHLRALSDADTRAVAGGLADLDVPCQVVWGEADPYLPFDDAGRRLARALPDPDVRVLGACGHFTPLECPLRLTRALLDWREQGPVARGDVRPRTPTEVGRTRLDPARWRPSPAPALEGVYVVNHDLAPIERWEVPDGRGPEDVAVADDGSVFTGVEDGRLLRFPPDGGRPETVAATGGRPLGVELGREATLVVSDADRGLLWVEIGSGRVHELVTAFHGRPLLHVNNATVASDGTVYFSDSSTRYSNAEWRRDILESRPNGRVLAYHPVDGRTRLVCDGLFFANGVALSPDESFLVVAETGRYRLRRIWLAGPREGQDEVLLDNLPGFPDNVSLGPAGFFWVALANRRMRELDLTLPAPSVRRAIDALPDEVGPGPTPYGFVLGVDGDGRVVRNLQDPAGSYGFVTGVREHDGWLYLGSLEESAVGRVRLTAD